MSAPNINHKKLNEDTLLVKVPEALDNNNAHEMVEILTEAHENGFINIMMDMSGLNFISSAGVGSILGTVELFRTSGGDIFLHNLQEPIVHILEVLDLTDYLTVKSGKFESEKA